MGCLKLHDGFSSELRLILSKKPQKGEKKTGCCYPFGLQHQKANQVVGGNLGQKFKYQTQELEDNLDYNMYEFELRHYDAAIGRFVATDPYEQFESPYVAMGNNPVVSIDPDGGYCYDVNGNQISCPDGAGDFYNDYVDSEENHITIFDEVEVTQGEEEPINVRPEFKSINKLVGWEHTKAEIDLNIKGHRTEAANGGYYMVDASGNIIKGPIVGGAGLLEFINGGAVKTVSLLSRLKTLFKASKSGKWVYGGFKSQAKWINQMKKRGWTEKQITEAIAKGKSFKAVNKVNQGNGATRYVHPTTGRSVVLDDVTNEILQIGGDGFKW